MDKILLYLGESSVLMMLFYAVYVLVFNKETFFTLNRFYLLASVVVALLVPLLTLEVVPKNISVFERPIEEISKLRLSYYDAMAGLEFDVRNYGNRGPTVDTVALKSYSDLSMGLIIVFFVYSIGVAFYLYRNVMSIRLIQRLISSMPKEKHDRVTIVRIPQIIAPFSFFRFVFVNDETIRSSDFAQILAHEKTHIEQRHSIDLVFVQIVAVFFWFNPVMWYLIKSLKTTHEYIADKKIIASGYSMVEYQALLLKQLISNNSHGLVHNFNLSFIKKRIAMMKNRKSGWLGKVKVALAIIGTMILSAAVIQCNTKLDEGPKTGSTISDGVNMSASLPVLPKTGHHFKGDKKQTLKFVIAGDKLSIDGQQYRTDEIASAIESRRLPAESSLILMHIDKDQKMGFVRDVEFELRKADRRMVVYVGVATDGSIVETPILLPPTPDDARRLGIFVESDMANAESEGRIAILKFRVGDGVGDGNQEKVHGFVKEQLGRSSTDYVVSLKYSDDDNYGAFLTNLHFIREGYNQIYQERAKSLFGKDYYDVSKEEYKLVRKDAPMAISIAER